jgi:uncharacterized HhH-GPD family protein
MALALSGDPKADQLLSQRPIALLIGMVLDQQVPMERAFSAPYDLQERLGRPLSAKVIAELDPDVLMELFTRHRALHRFPGAMATRVQKACQMIVDEWGGKPERLWTTAATGDELVTRLKALPGFGEQKAKIFGALLGKQLECQPKGWREATAPYGKAGTTMSIADISDAKSFQKVREHKKAAKAANRAKAT